MVIFELLVSCVLPLCVIAFSYILTARHFWGKLSFCTWGDRKTSTKYRQKYFENCGWAYCCFSDQPRVWSRPLYPCYYQHRPKRLSFFWMSFNNWIYNLLFNHAVEKYITLINSYLNPVALFCPFRQHLKRYLTCFCKANSPPSQLKLATKNWLFSNFRYFLELLVDYIYIIEIFIL